MNTVKIAGWSRRAALTLLLCAGWLGAAQAAGPAGSPDYVNTGKIYSISHSNNSMVIDDREYRLASNIKVYAGNRVVSASNLSAGMIIGFNATDDGSKFVLTEIWMTR